MWFGPYLSSDFQPDITSWRSRLPCFSILSAVLFLLLKSLMLSPLFSPSLSLSLHLPCHLCVYFLSDNFISSGMVPFENERKHEILKLVFYFPFIACPLYFILVLFKIIFFLYFYDMSEHFVHFFAQLHINDHLFVPMYCILLF